MARDDRFSDREFHGRPIQRDVGKAPRMYTDAHGADVEKSNFQKILYWLDHPDGKVDFPFLLTVILLLSYGLVMLYSASSSRAYVSYGDSLWFIKQQLVKGVFLGGIGMFLASRMDYHAYGKMAKYFMIGTMIALVVVLIPGVGTTRNGATRWLFGLQPSEFAKAAVILFFAYSMSQNQDKLKSFTEGFLPYVIIIGIYAFLLLLEPHMSCVVLIGATALIMMIVAGCDFKHIALLFVVALVAGFILILIEPYRLERLVSFGDPFADAQDTGFQIVQSLYAIGSGGLFGVGLGQSRQKYLSLPEPQNDFIFSVLAEELGFVGVAVLVGLFIFLVVRGTKIASKAPDLFGSLLAMGVVALVALQALINIAVVTASMPVTGMPLPFFSFGGTALAITMTEIGVVLNVSRQTKGL